MTNPELQRKCRRLFYAKVAWTTTGFLDDGVTVHTDTVNAGDVVGIASGGGAVEELTGDGLIIATFNDHTAPSRIGCVEEYFNPIDGADAKTIDLTLVQACHDAVTAHREAKADLAQFLLETSVKLFSSEVSDPKILDHSLVVAALKLGDEDAEAMGLITSVRDMLKSRLQIRDDCALALLTTRDAAITFDRAPVGIGR